jgi:hypothetical protein
MATANAGYHLYNTGDVLSAAQVQYNLQNQTVMYFASSAARTTALSGVLVEGMVSYIPANGLEYYNGSAWVLVAADQTPLTTKGDLFTYSTTDTRLPVGSDGQTLVANSANATGLGWQAPVQQNPVLNSAMQVWQRGTSIGSITTAVTYTADRWCAVSGASTTLTVSRQATSDTTNLPNIQYASRVQRNSGQTGTIPVYISQSLETVNSIPFAGKAITLSFYARAGANFSASGLTVVLNSGTGTDQNVLATFTGTASVVNSSAVTTTTWQRFTYTGTVPTTSTQLGFYVAFTPVGTAGTNDYFEITGVQLEVGSVATPFHTFSTTLQGELAACQRYYQRITNVDASTAYICTGIGQSTTRAFINYPSPVALRTAPSISQTSAKMGNQVIANTAISVIAYYASGSYNQISISTTIGSALLTAGSVYQFALDTNAYIEFSSEL